MTVYIFYCGNKYGIQKLYKSNKVYTHMKTKPIGKLLSEIMAEDFPEDAKELGLIDDEEDEEEHE